MRAAPILAILVLLTACGDDSRTAGGVSKAEADALDDAAAMIEAQRLPAQAIEPAGEPETPAGAASAAPDESGG